MLKLKVKKMTPDAILPKQAHPDDMYDLFSNEDTEINEHVAKIIHLGIAIECPKGYRAKIFARSSLPLKMGLVVSNSVGIIDSCLDIDTKITLVNGEQKTIKELLKTYNKEKTYAISINEKDGSYAAGLITNIWCKGQKEVYRYYFDKGGYIDCTEDHLIRLNRKPEYKKACEIKTTNSLTPLCLEKDKNGYLIVRSWKKDTKFLKIRLHRDIYKNFYNCEYPPVVHHKDENVSNNNPENLQGCSYYEHSMEIHNNKKQFDEYRNSEEGKKHQKSFGKRMAMNEKRIKNAFSSENREKSRQRMLGKKFGKEHNEKIKKAKILFWKSNKDKYIDKLREQMSIINAKNRERIKIKLHNSLDLVKNMLNEGITFTKENYKFYKKQNMLSYEKLLGKMGGKEKLLQNICNHKIIKVEKIGIKDVYDVEIRDYHNFFANGICVHNCYRGEIGLICNSLNGPVKVKKGDKIAQLQLEKIEDFEIEEVEELSETERGTGGFGSTGTK